MVPQDCLALLIHCFTLRSLFFHRIDLHSDQVPWIAGLGNPVASIHMHELQL